MQANHAHFRARGSLKLRFSLLKSPGNELHELHTPFAPLLCRAMRESTQLSVTAFALQGPGSTMEIRRLWRHRACVSVARLLVPNTQPQVGRPSKAESSRPAGEFCQFASCCLTISIKLSGQAASFCRIGLWSGAPLHDARKDSGCPAAATAKRELRTFETSKDEFSLRQRSYAARRFNAGQNPRNHCRA